MRVYDTFLFDGELDLLEHRLREAYDLVDIFVIVEAGQTFQGRKKSFTFADHRDRFAWAAQKLRRVALHALGPPTASPWERQRVQRDAILLGLRDAEPDDIVLILDADEVPSQALLKRLRTEPFDLPRRLAMTRHYEYLDLLAPRSPCCPSPDDPFPFAAGYLHVPDWGSVGDPWFGHSGVAVHFRDVSGIGTDSRSPYEWRRMMRHTANWPDSGRHFCATDPAARLETKLHRVSHTEFAGERGLQVDHLRRTRRYGVHHHGWWFAEQPAGPLPDDLERLAARFPNMKRNEPLPQMVLRRMVRSWAWLRFASWLPDSFVFAVDRHFEFLLPLLALPLLVADAMRALGARLGWRWMRAASLEAVNQHHG